MALARGPGAAFSPKGPVIVQLEQDKAIINKKMTLYR
jgi:hypothetical protein